MISSHTVTYERREHRQNRVFDAHDHLEHLAGHASADGSHEVVQLASDLARVELVLQVQIDRLVFGREQIADGV